MVPMKVRDIPGTFERQGPEFLQVRDGIVAFEIVEVPIFDGSGVGVGTKTIALLIGLQNGIREIVKLTPAHFVYKYHIGRIVW
jgi:hypothetical protein